MKFVASLSTLQLPIKVCTVSKEGGGAVLECISGITVAYSVNSSDYLSKCLKHSYVFFTEPILQITNTTFF